MISREALTRMIQDIKGKNVIEGIQIAQLHFPDAKLAWAEGSTDKKQVLHVDEYAITWENGQTSITLVSDHAVKSVDHAVNIVKQDDKIVDTPVQQRSKPFIG